MTFVAQRDSRFDHSVGVARIVWHFTRDAKQAVAGLLHDVATPVFAHVVDFLKGDYLVQESTEDGTRAIIEADATLQRYPVADNDSPKLSADRLEYTLGNLLNYRICSADETRAFYGDLSVAENEAGEPELAFSTAKIAEAFALASLACSKVYVSREDRYAMQMLSELLRAALDRGVLSDADLYATEPEVIAKLLGSEATAAEWRRFCAMHSIRCADAPQKTGAWRRIAAKKRCIDPLIIGTGRVSAYAKLFAAELGAFLSDRIYAETRDDLLRYLTLRTNADPEAEDLFQEVYRRFYDRLMRGVPVLDPRRYLFSVAKKVLAGYYRSSAKRKAAEQPIPEDFEVVSDDEPIDERLLREERMDEVWRLLKHEPEINQRAFVLYYGYDRSQKEIAAALGIREEAVRQRLYRTRERIRAMLERGEQERRQA